MSRQKLFVLCGAGSTNEINLPHSLYSVEYLKQYNVPVTFIGDPETGFELYSLARAFSDNIEGGDVINILLAIHGEVDEETGEYKLFPNEDGMNSSQLISAIVEACGARPLKILAISCYGANLQKDLELLPLGSSLMTLSNLDLTTDGNDSVGPITELLPEFFRDHGFKLEHLFESLILTERFSSNVPQIGTRNLDGSLKIVKAIDLVPHFASKPHNSPFIDFLVAHEVLSPEQLSIARVKAVETSDNPATLLCPKLIDQVIDHWKNGTLEAFIAECEAKYYFPGTITTQHHLLLPFSDEIPTTGHATHFMSEALYAYYKVKWEHIDEDPLVMERDELMYSEHRTLAQEARLRDIGDLPNVKRCGEYRVAMGNDSYNSFQLPLIFCPYSETVDDSCTRIDPVVGPESAHYFTPVASVCMGLAVDNFFSEV